ncbi:MAG: 3-deoxy-8-phosphooctulonate synthase [Candidatus Delongbacteria bacterium]|nr:3-deoxy-8-phosphooctulonate synthase [Candidatus Delongbacteria bacterium]
MSDQTTPAPKVVSIGDSGTGVIQAGQKLPLVLVAGPCVIESEQLLLETATAIKAIAARVGIPFIFKSSYLKDNRSQADYYRGPGLEEGLRLLSKVRSEVGVPVLSDIHDAASATACGEVLDVIQIPAYLSMQTSLAEAVAATGKVVNVKKGQFLAPSDMVNVVGKIRAAGNDKIILTERGTVHGYHNLVVDMRALPQMRSQGYPVMFDVTHAVRIYGLPSADPRGGQPEYIIPLARAGVAAGVDMIFIETHPDCANALCDAASMLPLDQLEKLLLILKRIHNTIGGESE